MINIENKLKQKIDKAIQNREQFYDDSDTTAFRVFNALADEIDGLTIDYYDGYYLITWYSIDTYNHKNEIVKIIQKAPNYKGLYQKKRFDTTAMYLDDNDDFVDGIQAPKPLIIKENGVNFATYLDDGAMTGIFLDQKEVRKTIRDKYSLNKTMLNTFSYTGAFSVYSAIGGAKQTTSVDLANRSLPKTKEQFSINNIDPNTQNIIVQDVFGYFKFALKKGFSYDLVVLDPPSFARTKKRTFSVLKDYTKLLKEAIAITNKGGIIVASTNSNKLQMNKFKEFVRTAFKETNTKYEIKETFRLPKDFMPNNQIGSNYLKVLFIKKV
jgi:23S rRNA (cytosine1962-C5)-methyltransferase